MKISKNSTAYLSAIPVKTVKSATHLLSLWRASDSPQIKFSIPQCPNMGYPWGENIVDTIKNRLFGKKVHVIFMLSQNYYTSVMCLNEMGAAWILQHTYTSILLPGYEYRNIKGAIDAGKVGIKLDGDPAELRARLIQLRNQIQKEFRLPPMDEITWNRKLDYFMNCIKASDSVFAAP